MRCLDVIPSYKLENNIATLVEYELVDSHVELYSEAGGNLAVVMVVVANRRCVAFLCSEDIDQRQRD